jgi:uncharacterized protein YqhQ
MKNQRTKGYPLQGAGKPGDLAVGGQAVPGGVAILAAGRHVTAVRAPSGEIRIRVDAAPPRPQGIVALPVVRGAVALGRALRLGIRSIQWAIPIWAPEQAAPGRRGMVGSTAVALVLALGLFVVGPAAIADVLTEPGAGRAVAEAGARIAAFLGYVLAVSRLASVREVFRYHGAEHRAVAAHEAGLPLLVEHARHLPIRHPRCGTNFMLLVILLGSALFAVVPDGDLITRMVARVLLLPLVVGVTYELQRYAASRPAGSPARLLLMPGLALQRLTTGEPDDDQLEVALLAVATATGVSPLTVAELERAPTPV